MPLLLLPFVVVGALIAIVPFSLYQRYRIGTSRQRARRWLTSLNLFGISISTILFLAGAAITSAWIPQAFTYSCGGLLVGCLLGIIGLRLTRWEHGTEYLHFTPNRLLVLAITLLVTARIGYGLWRSVYAWRAGLSADWYTRFGTSGVAGSMAAGAVVLGYYLVYWIGVRRRLRRHALTSRR